MLRTIKTMRTLSMTTKTLVLAGLLLSSPIALGEHHHNHQPKQNKTQIKSASKPDSFSDVIALEHRKAVNTKLTPKPPRLVPPNEYERIQMAVKSAPVSLLPPANKTLNQLNESKHSANVTAATSCTSASELIGLTGEALVSAIKAGSLTSCLYGLYNADYAGTELFSDANLLSVVNAINTLLVTYDGSDENGAVELEKLVTYLRAMHWAESSTGRTFQSTYQTALTQAFNAYFAGEHFVVFNGESSRDFMIRFEMLILVNSSNTDRQPYLARFSEALLGYANTVSRSNDWGVYYQEQGVTNLLVHLFNANSYEESAFEATLTNNPEIIDNLIKFITTDGTWLIGHTREYQWADSITELGRMLKFSGVIADKVRPTIQNILNTYSFDGTGSSGWINAQSMVKFYDSANCSLYGDACDFSVEDNVLSGNYSCSDTVKIRYQGEISNENLMTTCNTLNAGQDKFHLMFGTNSSTPVANDFNEALEVVVFSSSTQYESYAGDFFGINTNNGGMYLEDNPFSEDSQARFIAFQATWLPGFSIWNLEHEQYHYLDGRFNKWGSFSDQPENSVWWGEGLAEYLSQPATNPNALAVAADGTYQLSDLFQTTYANSDTSRTYYWGYLATRFMMENHREEIDGQLLPSMRAVKYNINGDSEEPTEGCQFDWGWQAKPDAEANGWGWLYDDSENGYSGNGYWVWTCGQPESDEDPIEEEPLPEFTPYQDILTDWGTRFDNEFNEWLTCLVDGEGYCEAATYHPADLDKNNAVDIRDINIFSQLLRQSSELGLEYDFNNDLQVNNRDVRAMTTFCDLPRCAIAE